MKKLLSIFAAILFAGSMFAAEYCQVSGPGDIKFKASRIIEGTNNAVLVLVTNPEWLEETEPSSNGTQIGIQFIPKQGTLTDLRGAYDLSEIDYVGDVIAIIKTGSVIENYKAKTGTFGIWANEDEDAYDFEYDLTFIMDDNEPYNVSGYVYDICSEDINIKYCPVTSEATEAEFDFVAAEISGDETELEIAAATSPNSLLPGYTVAGSRVVFKPAFKNRKDLRGTYAISDTKNNVNLTIYDSGSPLDFTPAGSFTIVLNANKTTYDLNYNFTVTVGSETQKFNGKIKGICDSEMDIEQAIENVSAQKVNGNKILRNGHLFIEHHGHLYNANGIQIQ
ncbi:MAG: hypothetical protein IJQ95_04490 [Paludibacteraceae bacterium]|nr:hypothetical protein [Paludibacteraceae bacterium]